MFSQLASSALLTLAVLSVASPAAMSRSAEGRDRELLTTHFVVTAGDALEPEDLRIAASAAEDVYAEVAAFTGGIPSGDPIRCTIYSTLEAKGLATGFTTPAHAFSASGTVVASMETGFDGEGRRELAVVLLRRALGTPLTHLLEEGLSVRFAERWWGMDRARLFGLASALAATGLGDDLDRWFDRRRVHTESGLIVRVAGAALVDRMIERWGRNEFLDRYALWRPDENDMAAIRADWQRLAGERRGAGPVDRPPRRAANAFERGFCHAHEGYRISDGYLSSESDRALAELHGLGVNAVSLTPFTYMRDPRRPSPLRFSQGAGEENDEGVVHAARAAHRLGMAVMLKPHIWIHGSWPGEIEMPDPGDWKMFFDEYFRWIRHYAILAEINGVESLCVGVEMSRATLTQAPRWRDLIDRVRKIYGGRILYAANWGEEFERIEFWDALDAVGIDCYYPLSDSSTVSDDDLRRAAAGVLDRIEAVSRRVGKPAVITEIGFTSTPACWIDPYTMRREQGVDLGAQARCYEAYLSELANRGRIVGVYWWKWPSSLDRGGTDDRGFTPRGKPAEAVVKKWYGGGLGR